MGQLKKLIKDFRLTCAVVGCEAPVNLGKGPRRVLILECGHTYHVAPTAGLPRTYACPACCLLAHLWSRWCIYYRKLRKKPNLL